MQIVILSGGKGTRLYPLTKKNPKSMIKFKEKFFFEYQIELLKKNQIKEIVLCVGIHSDKIIKYFGNGDKFGISIKYSIEQNKLLGTGGALKRAEHLLEKKFMVMYGDSYLPIDFKEVFDFFAKSEKLGLMTVFKNNNKFDKSNVEQKNGKIITYDKSGKSSNLEYIDYGLLAFQKKSLELISKNKEIDISFLISKLIKKNQIVSFEVFQRFYEIGSFQGIKDFKNNLKNLK